MIDHISCHLLCESRYIFYTIAFLIIYRISYRLPGLVFSTLLSFSRLIMFVAAFHASHVMLSALSSFSCSITLVIAFHALSFSQSVALISTVHALCFLCYCLSYDRVRYYLPCKSRYAFSTIAFLKIDHVRYCL